MKFCLPMLCQFATCLSYLALSCALAATKEGDYCGETRHDFPSAAHCNQADVRRRRPHGIHSSDEVSSCRGDEAMGVSIPRGQGAVG